ncbi:MAG: isoleucine--tRNA ligase [bacterium]|nr:isoleucine--tRNA ligase [bacterium]
MADVNEKSIQKSPTALREEETLKFWEEKGIFKKSLEKESPKGNYVFFDGPPFATGSPHYGHILAGTMKDVIPRFKTMQGYHVPRRWGWDCHGLPIENMIEKELNLNSKKDIEEYGIEKFTEAARASVLRYDSEWKEVVPRTGRWIDMDNAYLTMDTTYTESIWWSFKTLFEKKYIYRGFKSMHLCPRCETTLSNFEVAQGYKDIVDISVYAKFELMDEPGAFVIAWTTTPWTLPGNVALAVNAETEYVKAKKDGAVYIVAKPLAEKSLKEGYEIIAELNGKELVGKSYKPLFPYYQSVDLPNKENGWKIFAADFVTTEDGTGVVHIAPGYGEDDYQLSLKEKLPFIQHVGVDGHFKKEVTDFVGQIAKPKDDHQKGDVEIIKYLAKHGTLFAKEKITHSYPHCWRCDTPLLNYASSSWFVKVTDMKEKLLDENKKVHWVPEDIGEGRFGKWLEGARDWAISRTRYWGAPLPVWMCKSCDKIEVVGSIAELEERSGKTPKNKKGELDLHRPYIDEVTLKCSCEGEMKRVPDVFDTWYESGSMTYGQHHYPFENKELIDNQKGFPADFIAEGLDQTRGWFYSLLVLSTGLFGLSPYKNVIVNGIVLAEDGQKMSKRLKNYPEVRYVFDKYGADAMRYYLLASPVVKGQDLGFSEKGLDEVSKKIIIRLQNVFSFYAMYQHEEHLAHAESKSLLDQWIIARLNEVARDVTTNLEKYELDRAARPFMDFIDDLSTWYLRRSRDRFKSDDVEDKKNALATTRYVLVELSKLMAPFMPFLAEDVYQKVKGGKPFDGAQGRESVHLENWSEVKEVNQKVIEDMAEVRKLVSIALEVRSRSNIKVRQPLAKLAIKSEKIKGNQELLDLIADEVNVKEVVVDASLQNDVDLDTTISESLKQEGNARELIRGLQELRKKMDLNPQDAILLTIDTTEIGKSLVEQFKAEIAKTAQVKDIMFASSKEGSGEFVEVDGIAFKLQIVKVEK